MRTQLIAAATALSLTCSVFAVTAGQAGAATRITRSESGHPTIRHHATTHTGVSAPTVELLDLINAERAQAGDGPLRVSSTLDTIAQARSQDMTDRHYFSHRIPGVGYVFTILDRDHVGYQMAGENIALNNYLSVHSMAETVRLTNTDLMNSPEHRANILEPKYSEIGLGMAVDTKTDVLIVTEVFIQP